jgi:hypothetical protein
MAAVFCTIYTGIGSFSMKVGCFTTYGDVPADDMNKFDSPRHKESINTAVPSHLRYSSLHQVVPHWHSYPEYLRGLGGSDQILAGSYIR